MMALVVVATMAFKVPSPDAHGYLNLGDGFILLTSYFLGPLSGFLAGGVGSALADIIGGYSYYAPFTLIIKGLEGLFMGFAIGKCGRKIYWKQILLAIISEIIMIIGYFFALAIMTQSLIGGILSIPGNIFQGGLGIIIFILTALALEKTNIHRILED